MNGLLERIAVALEGGAVADHQKADSPAGHVHKPPIHGDYNSNTNTFIFYKTFQGKPTINENNYIKGSACPNGCLDVWKNNSRPQELLASGHWRKDERSLEEKGYPKDCFCPKCWKKQKQNFNIEWRD